MIIIYLLTSDYAEASRACTCTDRVLELEPDSFLMLRGGGRGTSWEKALDKNTSENC